jgi:hypothetical protein
MDHILATGKEPGLGINARVIATNFKTTQTWKITLRAGHK